jgi:hypothetical protein
MTFMLVAMRDTILAWVALTLMPLEHAYEMIDNEIVRRECRRSFEIRLVRHDAYPVTNVLLEKPDHRIGTVLQAISQQR